MVGVPDGLGAFALRSFDLPTSRARAGGMPQHAFHDDNIQIVLSGTTLYHSGSERAYWREFQTDVREIAQGYEVRPADL
jgi:hypothetical protein